MPNTINSAPKRRSSIGGRAEQNGSGDHWVTIDGHHVLIRESLGGESLVQKITIPPSPRLPGVNQSAWDRNVEQTHISDSLGTVHDLGLIVFGETQSYTDRPDSNKPIETAREEMAHSIINADEKWGFDRPKYASTHGAVEPPESALNNPAVRAAYESSMKAAREAFLSGNDPTNGAVWAIAKKTASRSNHVFTGPYAKPEGVPISTQAGPYNNSYTGRDMPSRVAWLNTYGKK